MLRSCSRNPFNMTLATHMKLTCLACTHYTATQADELLNALAPPQRTPAPTAAASTKIAPRPHTNAQAHAASNVREGARRGGASPPSSRQGTLPASTAARAGHSSKTRGAGAGRGAEAGGVGGVGEWTLERGCDAGDSAALATSFFPDSGDQAMRNQVSCIVPGRVRVPLPAALCRCAATPYQCLPPTTEASLPLLQLSFHHLSRDLCLPGNGTLAHTTSSSI